jgi:hypothetical protein
VLVVTHEAAVIANQPIHGPMIVEAAVPILPILLLPFILFFFIVIFPIWLVALGVLGLLLLLLRGAAKLSPSTFDGPAKAMHRAFRWVLTFAGFTERGKNATPT